MSKHICLVGGSGFVGRSIARQAIDCGYQVSVACRHPERARDMQIMGIRMLKADICSGRGLDEAVQGADCVINLVGLLFERGTQNFAGVHIHGTEHLLAACDRAGVPQYLHMSALGAKVGSLSKYAHSKAEAEQRVRQSQLLWSIMRPSIIYGQHDAFFNRFRHLFAYAPVVPLIGLETRFQPVWVEDVARAFVTCIGKQETASHIYELGGPDIYTLRELLEALFHKLGWKRRLVPLPPLAASVLARWMELLPTPPFTRDQLKLLKQDNIVRDEAFPAIFGRAASLDAVLPGILAPDAPSRLQQSLDWHRKRIRANIG